MRPDAFAPPLTVWAGPVRYIFPPGRDVTVGYGPAHDIPLERLGPAAARPPGPPPDVVLRFTGTRWVAIDRSPGGIFVNGSRATTVEIRDGQAVTLGDPQRGPRLVFQFPRRAGPPGPPSPPLPRSQVPPPHAAPRKQVAPPPPAGPQHRPPGLRVPTQRTTQRIQVSPPRPPTARPSVPPAGAGPAPPHPPPIAPAIPLPAPAADVPRPPVPPTVPPVVAAVPPVVAAEQPRSRGLIQRMSEATRKLRAQRPSFRSEEGDTTYRLPLRPGARTLGVAAYGLGLAVDGREVLTNISFTASPGTLTAITGPSATHNSALLGLLAGTRRPSAGAITVDGHDVHAEPESMRARIGIVTGDDALHRRLTVEQVLRYAAELRLPPDTSADQRGRVVTQVLEELGLTPHRATKIRKLPPELRRCASLAVELVTRPTLLVVDEPGSGLDAAQQSHVMAVLRRQADLGCVVVVAMSPQSPANLNLCDQVLLLTSAGSTAFLGAPLQLESSMGSADWSKVIARAGADPDAAHRAYSARNPALTPPPDVASPWPLPARLPVKRQIRWVARRELRLLIANPGHFTFLVAMPLALAALTLLIPGKSGLQRPNAGSANPHEAVEILAALNIAAVIIGTVLTLPTLVRERRAVRREQAVGLSAAAYLAANLTVFGLAAAVLTAVEFAIVVAVRGGPAYGAVLLHNATAELYISVAVTAVVSAVIGLLLSTLGKSLREVLPLLAPVILASALFCGGLVTLVGTWGYDQISWLIPAQWGFAASASVVDLHLIDPLAADVEPWAHYSGWWIFDMMMLAFFGAVWAGVTWYRIRSLGEQKEFGHLPR